MSLHVIIDRVLANELSGENARNEAFASIDLEKMSPDEAQQYIQRLGEICVGSGAAVRNVKETLLERGDLLLRLEDAHTLSPNTRKVKWDAEHEARSCAHAAQMQKLQETAHMSLGRRTNKQLNMTVWKTYTPGSQWGTAFLEASEIELLRKPPTFWYALQLADLDEDALRASMGRLESLFVSHGRGRFPEMAWRQYDDILNRMPQPQEGVCTTPLCEETYTRRVEGDEAAMPLPTTHTINVYVDPTPVKFVCCCSLTAFVRRLQKYK